MIFFDKEKEINGIVKFIWLALQHQPGTKFCKGDLFGPSIVSGGQVAQSRIMKDGPGDKAEDVVEIAGHFFFVVPCPVTLELVDFLGSPTVEAIRKVPRQLAELSKFFPAIQGNRWPRTLAILDHIFCWMSTHFSSQREAHNTVAVGKDFEVVRELV